MKKINEKVEDPLTLTERKGLNDYFSWYTKLKDKNDFKNHEEFSNVTKLDTIVYSLLIEIEKSDLTLKESLPLLSFINKEIRKVKIDSPHSYHKYSKSHLDYLDSIGKQYLKDQVLRRCVGIYAVKNLFQNPERPDSIKL